jgi:hypothetical protein
MQAKIITDEDVTKRWAEHFEKLLKENGKEENIQKFSENNKPLTARLWIEDLTVEDDAIQTLKNHKVKMLSILD